MTTHANVHTLRRCAAFGLVIAVGLGAGLPAAHAQQRLAPEGTTLETRDALWKSQLAWQLTEMLAYELPNIRAQALQQIIFLAGSRDEAYDFVPAVPSILAIYERDPDESVRVMALSALRAIGDDGSMKRLQARVEGEPSKRVKLLTLAVLQEYREREAP